MIFSSINGDQGLQCSCYMYSCSKGGWNYPNGTEISINEQSNEYANLISKDGTKVTLYYKGNPPERGKFTCSFQDLHSYVYIIDMNYTDPTPSKVPEGDDAEFSISVETHVPDNSEGLPPIFYQWQKDCVNLMNNDKYRGMQSTNLSILNVQDGDQGLYRCVLRNVFINSQNPFITKEVNLTVGKCL